MLWLLFNALFFVLDIVWGVQSWQDGDTAWAVFFLTLALVQLALLVDRAVQEALSSE